MLRSAAAKVMWVGRATVFLVGLAVILALGVGAATTALAHSNVDNKLFHLGHPNSAATPTSLISTLSDAAKSALVVQNKGGGAALDLRVGNATTPANSVAPMKVNSSKVVTSLNADTVDGKSAADFYAAGSKVADSTHADQADSATSAQSAADADTLDGRDSAQFAGASHAHSGADITSGAVAERYIDRSVARDGEIMPTVLAQDGPGSGVDADKIDGKEPGDFASAAAVHPPELVTLTPSPPSGGGSGGSATLTKTLLGNGTFSLVATCKVEFDGPYTRYTDAKIEVQTVANDTTVVKGSFDLGSSSSTFDPPQKALLAHTSVSSGLKSADAGAFQAGEPGGEALHGQFRAEQISKDSTDPNTEPAQCVFAASALG